MDGCFFAANVGGLATVHVVLLRFPFSASKDVSEEVATPVCTTHIRRLLYVSPGFLGEYVCIVLALQGISLLAFLDSTRIHVGIASSRS